MFKHADPSSKIPTYLQAYTVENLKWQLKLTAVLLVGIVAYEIYDERKQRKSLSTEDK